MTTPASAQADTSAGVFRALVPIAFATTIVGLVGAFVVPLMALFLTERIAAGPTNTSVFLFLSSLTGVLIAYVAGSISDRPGGRRLILATASIAGVIGYTTYAFVQNFWVLLVAAVTLVALSGSLMPQLFALGREALHGASPQRAAMGMNSLRMALSLSWAAGAPLGTWVVGIINFDGLFIATAAAHLVILGIVLALTVTRKAARATGPDAGDDPAAIDVAPAGIEPAVAAPAVAEPSRLRLLTIVAAFIALQAVTSLTVLAMPLFISKNLHGSLASAGAVLGLCAATEIPLMLLFGALANRFSLQRLLFVGCGFGIAYAASVSLAHHVWEVAAAQVLHACFVATIGGLGITYFQQLMPNALGRVTTMFTNSNRIAGMLAGLVFGLFEVHGYRLAFVTALGAGVVGTVILATVRRPAAEVPAEASVGADTPPLRRRIRTLPRQRGRALTHVPPAGRPATRSAHSLARHLIRARGDRRELR